MKVTCNHCGNVFDYEKCNGICNICSRYCGTECEKKYYNLDKGQGRSIPKLSRIIIFLCLAIVMLLVSIVPYLSYTKESARYKQLLTVGQIKPIHKEVGEDFSLGSCTIRVIQSGLFTEKDFFGIPEGKKLIYVEFTDSDKVEVYNIATYLEQGEGEYIDEAYSSFISDSLNIRKEKLEPYMLEENGAESVTVRSIFFVDEGTFNFTFIIQKRELNEDNIQILKDTYKIPITVKEEVLYRGKEDN